MARKPGRDSADELLSQILSCRDASTGRPGRVKASVFQTEGYLRGLQGLPWEAADATAPSAEDVASSFLYDVRKGSIPLRGRLKNGSRSCLEVFQAGLRETFPVS